MADVVTVREAVKRAKEEGLPIAECALRRWIQSGEIPHRKVGRKFLLYWPNVAAYLKGESVTADKPAPLAVVNGIRRIDG